MKTIETWFLWLMIYSIIGWGYESTICSIGQRKLINRGFLNGPYCPIYGTGAVLVLLVLGRIQNPVLLFFAGALVTCSLEYLTSWLMEKLFHARWWDYSKRKFNIGGRVCLIGAVVFGAFSVVLVLLSSLLAACVTAFAGPISFVGIAVPHLVKQTLGSAKPLYVLPGCALGGAAFCLLCDLIARSLFAPTELSISSVTAVFGAPVVIWLLVRRHSGEGAA